MARVLRLRNYFLCSLLVLSTNISFSESLHQHQITVFIAKKIYTMDPGWPTATAVAVRDGKILSVGSLADLQPWLKGHEIKLVETFKNKILMPGFIEAHGHPFLGGVLMSMPLLSHFDIANPYGEPFKGLETRQDALKKLKEYERAIADPNKLLIAWGFDSVAFGGHLSKRDLDKISSTRPIIVWDASEHFAYLNSVAINQHNFTPALANKVNGVQVDSNGELNGQFLGTTAATLAVGDYLATQMQPQRSVKAMNFIVDLSAQGGITTQSELVLGVIDPDAEKKLYADYFNNPKTPMRLVAVSDIAGILKAKGSDAVDYILKLQKEGTDKIIFNGVKSFSDDSFLGFGMMMSNPGYIDGRHGLFINQGDSWVEQVLPFWKAGLQIHVHTNGNAGNDNTLALLAELQHRYPRFDHRFTFEHYGISTPAQARRVKALGGVVSINPYYVHYRGELNRDYIGAERASLAARFRTLLDAGVPTTMHSDTPIGPPKPLEWAWIAVNRFGQSGKVLAPSERITTAEAMRMITIIAAYILGVDDRIGSIEPGKFADFTVLEQDPYKIAPENLRDVPVWGTIVGGLVTPVSSIKQR